MIFTPKEDQGLMPYSSIKRGSSWNKHHFDDEWDLEEFESINKKFDFKNEHKETISGIESVKPKWNFSEEALGWLLKANQLQEVVKKINKPLKKDLRC